MTHKAIWPAVLALMLGPSAAGAAPPEHIPSAGGEVILATPNERKAYDLEHFAAARRVGDMLYLSGIIAGRRPGEGNDTAAFQDQARRAFRRIGVLLKESGADFTDVVMLNTFHVWNSPNFTGSRADQFAAFGAVKDEFMPPPYPAWTAVGTTGLLADMGIVEIQVIARIPSR